MIPLKDHNPPSRFPFINYLLLAANVLVFFAAWSFSERELLSFYDQYALIPAALLAGQNLPALLTSMFLHGSLAHLIGNLLFLHIFGDNLESALGHVKYFVFYLASGIGAAALQIFVSPASTIPMLGASGAIAGVMGGYLLLFPNHRIDTLFSFGLWFRRATVPAWSMLFYWIAFQFLFGFGTYAAAAPDTGGVAYFAHIGGFLTGLLLLLPFRQTLLLHNY